MLVSKIQSLSYVNQISLNKQQSNKQTNNNMFAMQNPMQGSFAKIPLGYTFGTNINFTGKYYDPNRTIPDIEFIDYHNMTETTKKRYRKRYNNFLKDIDKENLVQEQNRMPLSTDETIAAFIDTAKFYSQFKDQKIICLGRSPKWFLNASKWMKDGIDDYKFVAFSKYWFKPDRIEGLKELPAMRPTEKEEIAYKKYLKNIQADPQTIVNYHKETGKKVVITDFICTGKGASSFLDIMGRYADEQGILDEFANSIEIVGIGSMQFMERYYHDDEDIPQPEVIMPPILRPYTKKIKQSFHNLNYNMFMDMLYNQNVNECRSTYYPPRAWSIYKPDKFKTGLIKDVKKVRELKKSLKEKMGDPKYSGCLTSFNPEMADFRNILNFHILDEMAKAGVLRDNDETYSEKV